MIITLPPPPEPKNTGEKTPESPKIPLQLGCSVTQIRHFFKRTFFNLPLIFENNVKENRNLYQAGDLGEVYSISLAQTLGAYSLVTDDTKQGGPYMSLLNFEDEVMPFTFADVLILRYLFGLVDENQTVSDFDMINTASELNWTFRSQLTKFIKRFWNDPHRQEDVVWMQKLVSEKEIKVKSKIQALRKML